MIRSGGSGKLVVEGQRAFTVAEVLIAAAILVVGLLALATMFPTGYSTVTKSGIQSRGLALAQQRIEILRNTLYGQIDTVALPACPSGYTCTRAVQADPTINGTVVTGATRVTVTVALPSAGAPASQPIVLTTIVAK